MKNVIKVFCCLLIYLLLFSACGNAGNETQTEGSSAITEDPGTTATTETPAKPMIMVGADGKVFCTLTKPRNASAGTEEAIEKFVNDFKKKTDATIPVVEETEEIVTRYEIVVNATAGREPVAEQLENTPYTDYVICMWDWHIMVTARSDKALSAALKRIVFLLENLDEGYCLREDLHVQASAILGDRQTSVPIYETANGTELPLYSVRNGYEVCVQNTTVEEFAAYAEKLGKLGFAKYSENTISAGDSVEGKNRSLVYTGEDLDVFLTWNESLKTARVVFTDHSELPLLEKPALTADDTATPSIAQIGIGGLGMSFAIQLRDYSFIVIDGGTNAKDNIDKLYSYMVEKTPAGRKPTVACWIFTHSDPDHIGAPAGFLESYMDDFVLESVACNFPDCSVQDTSQDDETMESSIFALVNRISRFYTAKIYTVHTGQIYYFKGVEIEILFTEEDVYPKKVNSYNDTSVMARFTFDNGKTFMMLGDATSQISKQLAATYKEYLKSDILQLAHHGLIGGDLQLYKYIDPGICFWSTAQERFEGHWDTNKDGSVTSSDVQHCLGQGGCDYNKWIRDDSIRVRTHYHAGQTFVVNVENV